VISVVFKTPLKRRFWESVFIKLHFCIDQMNILVLHQAAPSHFPTKFRPWVLLAKDVWERTKQLTIDVRVI